MKHTLLKIAVNSTSLSLSMWAYIAENTCTSYKGVIAHPQYQSSLTNAVYLRSASFAEGNPPFQHPIIISPPKTQITSEKAC